MRYVLDASVAVKWFLPENHSDRAARLLAKLETGEVSLIAPESLLAEFGHAMLKEVRQGGIEADVSQVFMDHMLQLPVRLTGLPLLAARSIELATRPMGTFYDALYFALAEREDLMLLTADTPAMNAFAPLHRAIHIADFDL